MSNHHDADDHSARVRSLDLERGSKTVAGTRPPDPNKHLWVEPYSESVSRALHPGDSLTVVNRCDHEIRVCTGERVERLRDERDELEAENDQLRAALRDAIRRPMGVVPASAEPFMRDIQAELP